MLCPQTCSSSLIQHILRCSRAQLTLTTRRISIEWRRCVSDVWKRLTSDQLVYATCIRTGCGIVATSWTRRTNMVTSLTWWQVHDESSCSVPDSLHGLDRMVSFIVYKATETVSLTIYTQTDRFRYFFEMLTPKKLSWCNGILCLSSFLHAAILFI